MSSLLKELGLNAINNGTDTGTFEQHTTHDGPVLDSINPATTKKIASVTLSQRDDYERVVDSASNAFNYWQEVPAPKRGEFIRQIGEALRKNKDALGSLVALEMGKSKQEGDGEVQAMVDFAEFAAGQSRMLHGLILQSEHFRHRMFEQWLPYGVTGIITSFNFPVAVWAWNAFIAAVCGNTCIWKPSPKTPLCAIAVMNICDQVMKKMEYPGVFSLFISNDTTLIEHFTADSRVPLISFTGSVEVGKKVNRIVNQRSGRAILELGGNNAMIVDETADLNLAVPTIVLNATNTNGQRCTSLRRLYLHDSIFNTVSKRLVHAYQQITIGDPLDTNTTVGPLIDEHAVENFKKAVDAIKASGGEILQGGKVLEKPGYFVEPTLAIIPSDHPLQQCETFAPILYINRYKNFEEAIALQNNVPQGLSSSLFTTSLLHAELFLSTRGSDCGVANINVGTAGAEAGGSFGGEKESGGGRTIGTDAWKGYMRRQTVTINWSMAIPAVPGIKFADNL